MGHDGVPSCDFSASCWLWKMRINFCLLRSIQISQLQFSARNALNSQFSHIEEIMWAQTKPNKPAVSSTSSSTTIIWLGVQNCDTNLMAQSYTPPKNRHCGKHNSQANSKFAMPDGNTGIDHSVPRSFTGEVSNNHPAKRRRLSHSRWVSCRITSP